jgi:hypothetical protein
MDRIWLGLVIAVGYGTTLSPFAKAYLLANRSDRDREAARGYRFFSMTIELDDTRIRCGTHSRSQ